MRHLHFGIAPFGLQRKGLRPPIAKGFDPYEELYADADMWFQQGWCDYFAPQLYWKTTAATQPYQPLLEWWVKENVHKRNLYVGNFTGRVGEPPPKEEDEEAAATTQPANGRTRGQGTNRGGGGAARTAPATQGDIDFTEAHGRLEGTRIPGHGPSARSSARSTASPNLSRSAMWATASSG